MTAERANMDKVGANSRHVTRPVAFATFQAGIVFFSSRLLPRRTGSAVGVAHGADARREG